MSNSNWISIAETNIGTVRSVNEDDFFAAPHVGLWCVADGMGGHDRGDIASQMISTRLKELVANCSETLTVEMIIKCLQAVNASLLKLASETGGVVGSTVVVLFFEENKAHFIWAGDSRIYRLRDNLFKRVTRDHSQVEDMVDAGLIRPEDAESHPKANVITRAVGASEYLDLSIRTLDLEDYDQFILCSDGLNKVISDQELGYALQSISDDIICKRLIEISLARKARDNVTVIVVRKDKSALIGKIDDTLPIDATLPLTYNR